MAHCRFFLCAIAVVLAIIALGDYRHIQRFSHVYHLDRAELEHQLLENLVGQDPIKRAAVRGLRIVPGRQSHLIGIELETGLVEYFVGPDGFHPITMTLDMDAGIIRRSLSLDRPCLRSVRHSLQGQLAEPELLNAGLGRTIDYFFARGLGARLPDHVREQVSLNVRPATRVSVEGDRLALTLGLVRSQDSEVARWREPDPLSRACRES